VSDAPVEVVAAPARVVEPVRPVRPVAVQAAAVAATSFVAGTALAAVVRGARGGGGLRLRRGRRRQANVVATKSFLIDVHMLRD
jgi:hypothetical protein